MINIKVDKSDKCNGEYSLYISFPYDNNIVNIMRNQIIRYWNPDSKEWELPIKVYPDLIQELNNYKLNIIDSNKILSNLSLDR